MLLHRMIDHVKAQNWTAVALDFVIVVVGVYLGIQVNNWDQARDEKNTEATYLELLQRDLRVTIKDVEEQIAFEQFQIALANDALPLIYQSPSDLRRQKLATILTQLGSRRTLKIDSPTFLDLQSSGKLGLISDPQLRNDIVSYFFGIQRLEAVIDKNNEHFVDRGFNGFTDEISIGYWRWDDDLMESQLPSSLRSILQRRNNFIDPRLMQSGGAVLMAPPDDPIWDEVSIRIGKRASISIANEGVANALLDATRAIEQEIVMHIGEKNQ